jgi:hypothetical protein
MTGTGLVLGTVDYIAPEQADNARQADIRSDIYSLGCTLYHLLAGQPPFPTGTSLQKVMAHVEKKPQPLTELRPDLPEGFMPVLERMMAKNPKHRYQTPAEVALALEPFTLATAVARKGKPRRGAQKEGDSGTPLLEELPAYRPRWRSIMAVTATLLFVFVGLLGVAVYRIATDKGELVITSESPDVKVVITRGGEVVDVIDTKTDKQIRLALRSGEYELELKGAHEGLKLDIKNAKLTRGETVLATITRDNPGIAMTEPPPAKKPPEGVVAWWRADGDAKDSVGDSHGELKGGVTFDPGIAGKAFRLDGAGRHVEVTRSDRWGFRKRDFSIDLWVQFRALTPSPEIGHPMAIFIGCDEGNDEGNRPRHKWFFAYGGGFLNFHINQPNGESGFFAKANFSPDVDQWYHLAVTRSQGTFTFYVNGAPVASEKVEITIPNPDAPLTIGQAENIGFFSGLIDEVAIYDRALSPDEIKARWKALTPATTKEGGEKVGEVRRFEGANGLCGIAISPNGRYFLSTGRSIQLWDLHDRKYVRSFPEHGGRVHAVAFLPDSREFLSCCNDGTMRHWDVETGEQLHRADLGSDLYDVVVSPNGSLALTGGSVDKTVHLWDVKNWKEIRRFEGHTSNVQRVVFSADGRRALSGSWDKTARLWDVETGKELKCFVGHQGNVMGVALSPDGKQALSGGLDKTLRLWDVETGKEVRQFEGHTGVIGVAF